MKRLKRIGIFLAVISLITTTVFAAGTGGTVYTNTRAITDNLSYTNASDSDGSGGLQDSYALKMTGSGDAYPIVMKCDTIYGRMTIGTMIKYAESLGKNVLAAVNTDFFSMSTGVPLGIVVEDGVYKSSTEGEAAVGFTSDGKVIFSKSPTVSITLANNGGDTDKTDSGKTVSLTNFNKYRMDTGGMYLYSSAFSTVSTRTSTDGWYVKFKILSGTPSVSGTMSLEVVDTLQSAYPLDIGDGYLVLTAATAGGWDDEYAKFKTGDLVTMKTACSDPALINAKWATGGGDILIENGALTDQSSWDSSIAGKNPRTAFGVKADGTVVSYVADGRESDGSAGLTLSGLANEMLSQGCVYAVNFDGGGSSAMSVRLPGDTTGEVVNDPSDGSPRKCATYLLFVTDKKPGGAAAHLSLSNEGAVVLAGSSIKLAYTATDGGYMPVTAPSDVLAESSGLGTAAGPVYRAGASPGTDTVLLSSESTGASGKGSIHIIADPTSVTVTKSGDSSALTSLTLYPGDTVQLAASADYYGHAVAADAGAYKYAVTGAIGTVTDSGLFTAGTAGGTSGTITVTAGGTTASVNVSVTGFADTVDNWAKDYINILYAKGIVTGVSATAFEPDTSLTRGDFVLMLYRAAGCPQVSGASTFTDVAADAYYAKAVSWAQNNGVAEGAGDGLFSPQDKLTREQAFTFSCRAMKAMSIGCPEGSASDLSAFTDASSVSEYAVTPTASLVKMGVISGSGGLLNPGGNLTRAEMSKMLCKIIGLA